VKVAAIWRYPVKSLQGEALERAEVGRHGLVGDRGWAIVDDATGFTLTARREPRLLFAQASVADDGLRITLEGGATPTSDADLSDWLGRPVHLVEAGQRGGLFETPADPEDEAGEWLQWRGPGGAFHDSARTKVSLVSTATLGAWDALRFRSNVVVDSAGEDALVGRSITIGTTALAVLKHIDRCVVVTRPQPGIERDLDVLRTINRERATCLGVGATVTLAGHMAVGDAVAISGE
jgi:uncharacterized protein YcbX